MNHHQNDMNHPQTSSSYNNNNNHNYYYNQSYENPNPNPQFDQFHASAPPDPSIYYSSDYSNSYDHNFDPINAVYDPNSVQYRLNDESVYRYVGGESEKVSEVRFDDYGRPIGNEVRDNGSNDDQGVYRYRGGGNVRKDEAVRAPVVKFDDYGRPIGNEDVRGGVQGVKIVNVKPKVEVNEDVRSGVQKFRVMLLSEGGGGQGDMDVLCQIGLDGIRILDPATSRTLKVYSLDTVTTWEVLDSNIFAFWTKSSTDINPRRVRLKSNSYTTTNILDIVAAASIQLKEMDGVTVSEQQQQAEKRKGFPDWINLMKPGNEEKDHWVPDEASSKCTACSSYFGAFLRRHHCRNCGDIFCDKCTQGRIALTAEENAQQVRVCDQCLAEVTQRLSHVNEVAGRASGYNRHEELANKLQEEMEKKRKTTAELKSNFPDKRMKEVECPTCTVHLQVEVPVTGSKTIECSVCQHPFLVSAN